MLHIHNIYNFGVDKAEGTISLREVPMRIVGDNHIVIGDFNLHHPHWGEDGDTRQDDEAEELLQLVGEFLFSHLR